MDTITTPLTIPATRPLSEDVVKPLLLRSEISFDAVLMYLEIGRELTLVELPINRDDP